MSPSGKALDSDSSISGVRIPAPQPDKPVAYSDGLFDLQLYGLGGLTVIDRIRLVGVFNVSLFRGDIIGYGICVIHSRNDTALLDRGRSFPTFPHFKGTSSVNPDTAVPSRASPLPALQPAERDFSCR